MYVVSTWSSSNQGLIGARFQKWELVHYKQTVLNASTVASEVSICNPYHLWHSMHLPGNKLLPCG